VRRSRVEAVKIEDVIAVDPMRHEAGLIESAFYIRLLSRQKGTALVDERDRVQRFAGLETIACDERDAGGIHAAGEMRCGATAQARAHSRPQSVEAQLTELRDIIGARIDLTLQPIPVAALFHLAALQIEKHDGAGEHALNARVDGAAVDKFLQIGPCQDEIVCQVLLVQSAAGERIQQRRHAGARGNSTLPDRVEDGIAAHRVPHGDEAPLAGIPDHEGKIAFEALQDL
jgi:hypothetical protein